MVNYHNDRTKLETLNKLKIWIENEANNTDTLNKVSWKPISEHTDQGNRNNLILI